MRYFLIAFLLTMTAPIELLATRDTYEEQGAIITLAKQEALRQAQLNPLEYFETEYLSGFYLVPKQILAMQSADEHRYMFYGGARGPGKSRFIRWFLLRELLQLHSRGINNAMVGLFCEDYPSLIDRQVNKISVEFPEWLGEVKETKLFGFGFYLKEQYGSGVIALRNLDDPSKFQSAEFAAEGVDEITKNPVTTFNMLRGSLRWPGIDRPKFIAASNPGGIGHSWVRQYWIDRNFPPELQPLAKEFSFVKALPKDNPFLSQSYWDDLNTQPDRIRRAWVDGDWDAFQGQFFRDFDQDKELIDPFEIPRHWNIVGSIDPGWSSPCSFGLQAENEEGKIHRIFTYYEEKRNPEQHADAIFSMIKNCKETGGRMPSMIYSGGDAFAKKDRYSVTATDRTFADVFQSRGLILTQANLDRVLGWGSMGMLMPDRYFIFKGYNTPLVEQIIAVQSDEKNPNDIQGRGNDPNVEDHALDEQRYAIQSMYKIAPQKPQPEAWVAAWHKRMATAPGAGWKPGMG